jgi:uncharacterized protein
MIECSIILKFSAEIALMQWQDLFIGVGLVLILEGMLPFLSPEKWRKIAQMMLVQSDKHLRILGLIFMVIGLFVITMLHFSYYSN